MERHRRRHSKPATGRGDNLERLLSVAMSWAGPFTRDLGMAPSRGGRRPSRMEFNARHGFVAGIDLGPTRTRLAIADLRGARLAHRIIPTPSELPPPEAIRKIADAVRALMAEAGAPLARLLSVAAGAPGVVDLERGVVVLAPNPKGCT